MTKMSQYRDKVKRLQKSYKEAVLRGKKVALNKKTTNLFRAREQGHIVKLDVSSFDGVILVNKKAKIAVVEGMATYETIVAETLKYGLMPAVVPQLKTITLGGAVTGVGIESSSFKYGFPHETVLSMEILLPSGKVVEVSPTNEHKDLFYGFANSYGSLGYVLQLKIKLVPVKNFVKLKYQLFSSAADFLEKLQAACETNKYDFIDGMIIDKNQYYLVTAKMVNKAPYTSDYTHKNIFYRSITTREEDYLTISDYIWRWDTDWFWCSKNLGAQNSILRKIYGKKHLRSDFYMKLYGLENEYKLKSRLDKLLRKPEIETVIQDVEIPIQNCEKFLQFYLKNINILPVWVCPVKQIDPTKEWSLYGLDPKKLYINFGFWSSVAAKPNKPIWHNRLLEKTVTNLKGKKSLYSDAYYSESEFWRLYNKPKYSILKKRYDPDGVLKDLYQKTVKRG